MTATTVDHRPATTAGQVIRDLALLVGRIGLAVLMLAHAKLEFDFAGGSVAGVGRLFEQAGIPLPALTGPANLLLESVGGVAILLGLGVPVVAALMAVNMLGAWLLAHPNPLYALDHTGPETVIAIGLLSLVLAAVGGGRYGLDHLLARRLRTRRASAHRGANGPVTR